jgi:hypothetical protein
MFHCGIEWQPEVDSGSEASSEASSDGSDGSKASSESSEASEPSEEYSDTYEEDVMEESHAVSDELP